MESTVRLRSDQIEFFHQNGFLAIDSITTPEELAGLRQKYDQMFAVAAGLSEGNYFDLATANEPDKQAVMPQILNPEQYVPEFKQTLMRTNAQAIVRQLLGEAGRVDGAHCIYKPPRISPETPWHQDEAYWNPAYEYHSLSIWVPMQQATVEMGCMWFVPGTHRWEVLPHRHINDDPRVHGLELIDHQKYAPLAVACPLPAGGATIHLSRTLHYAGPNRSEMPRRAYILGGGVAATKRAVPRRYPWLEHEDSLHTQKKAEAAKREAAKAST
jgi:ectoine hydroxylase-related dioxygenase (phytanoyl-CoA dioxygenase family)